MTAQAAPPPSYDPPVHPAWAPPPGTDPAAEIARHLDGAISGRTGWTHLGVVGDHGATATYTVPGVGGGNVTGTGGGWWWGAWDVAGEPVGENFIDGDPLPSAQAARDAVEQAVHFATTPPEQP